MTAAAVPIAVASGVVVIVVAIAVVLVVLIVALAMRGRQTRAAARRAEERQDRAGGGVSPDRGAPSDRDIATEQHEQRNE